MGIKSDKRARRIAEKTAKAMALELAKSQIIDIANSPFRIRWQFCKAILFPRKMRMSGADLEAVHNKSYGVLGAGAGGEKSGDN